MGRAAAVAHAVRPRRHLRRPPDLTSLFDVLFIVVFAALIRAAAVQRAAEPAPAPPAPPAPPAAVAELRAQALAQLSHELAERAPLVVRISATGVVEAIEADGRKLALSLPLLEASQDPDRRIGYLGDQLGDRRICRIAAGQLGTKELSRYLVIMAPAVAFDALPDALYQGLLLDLRRCAAEQRTVAALVPPSAKGPP